MTTKRKLGDWAEDWSDIMKVEYPPDDTWETAAQIAKKYNLTSSTARRRLQMGEEEGKVKSKVFTPRDGGKPTTYYKRIKQK